MHVLRKVFGKSAELDGTISKDAIGKYLPPSPTIVEAGAHVGVDTAEMAALWPSSKIYAFEPVPGIYKQLVANVRPYKNIKAYKLALSNKTGKNKIYVSGGRSDGSSSLLKPKEHLKIHPDVTFNSSVDIETITLEDWMLENKVSKVDFLWLDMQGFELQVLKSCKPLLKHVSAIYTEVNLVENYEKGALYEELKSWLNNQGFEPTIERMPWADGGNVLFIKTGRDVRA